MKKLSFFLFLHVFILSLTSCVDSEEINRSSYVSYAVIDHAEDMGGYVLNLPNVVLAAPELASSNLTKGNCIQVHFTIDYNNQPFSYYTATGIQYKLLNNTSAKIESGDMNDEYKDSINRITLEETSPLLLGNLFVNIERKEESSQLYSYELICNPDSIDEKGVNTVFLKAHQSDKTAGNATNFSIETFNLKPLFEAYGEKDSTVVAPDPEQIYILLNLKYQSGIKEGIPVYKAYNNEPLKIAIFK
ncbi:MAG: hypothetical protein LBP83_07465 [Dysgonamonadaceae bacterium]|nr:hypothetical protein [Dysgonamonadaceae bacterium]